MKKILIFYASYGGGHLSAAESILKYLQSNYTDINVELVDCVKYTNKTLEKMTTTAYKEMAKKMPWVWGRLYYDSKKWPIAHITSRANSFMAIRLLKLLREKNPDIVISTHPFSSQMCAYLKRKNKVHFKLATILTDFKSHDQWLVDADCTDFFFVSNKNMKKELEQKNISSDKIFITGIPLRKEFLEPHDKNKILNELNFSKKSKTLLFFGGGEFGLGKSSTLGVFEYIMKNFPNLQVIAISGKNKNMNLNFSKIVMENNRTNNTKIFEYTDKVADFMSISDVVITKPGGLTASECLVSGVPMIIINPIPGQEEENAEFLENNNVAKWIKKEDEISSILNSILNDENKLLNMKTNTKLIAKPNSTKDICKIILS